MVSHYYQVDDQWSLIYPKLERVLGPELQLKVLRKLLRTTLAKSSARRSMESINDFADNERNELRTIRSTIELILFQDMSDGTNICESSAIRGGSGKFYTLQPTLSMV